MAIPVNVAFATPPEGTCPSTFTDAVAILNALVAGTIQSNFTPYILGAATPSVEDQDKAWIRLDGAGRPLGTFLFYGGSWRRQYNGKFNEITIFNGNPSLFFDSNGRGLTTSEWDGWHLCNGLDGVIDLSDRFIVAAHMNNDGGVDGYAAGWRTTVTGATAAQGGQAEVTLTRDQGPTAAVPIVVVDTFDAGATRDPAGKVYGIHSTATGDPGDPGTVILVDEVAEANAVDPVPTVPPYYALAFAVFIGYA